MSLSPNSSIVQRTIDLTYDNSKRATSLRWIFVNLGLFMLFAYDLCSKCTGYTGALHYVELALAGVAGANTLQHCARLARRRPAADGPCPAPRSPPLSRSWDTADVSVAWRADSSPPPSPPSASPPAPRADRAPPDHFIADPQTLAAYLRSYSERTRAEPTAAAPGVWGARAAPDAGHYQLAAPAVASEEASAAGGGAAPAWRRVALEPARLEQWTLNLRVWLHATIVSRLARELSALDAALGAAALQDARLASLVHHHPVAQQLLPYLEPFADQRYVIQRIKELSAGGCLSNYRWNGGGSEWDDSKPTDAELLLHLVSTYLDAQLPAAPGARPWSAAHVSNAAGVAGAAARGPGAHESGAAARGPGALVIQRLSARPPHYALLAGDELLHPARGRNNLLHTLLLWLAAAAQRPPPALRRLHLGRAGLNMLWIIGR